VLSCNRSGRDRTESDRWVLFRSHMGFDPFYCQPGVGGAHEKGGVEHEGGRFRRNHLVPVPKVASLAELNTRLQAADEADDTRRIAHRARTVGQDFAVEAPLLRPLPVEGFEAGLSLHPLVDRHSRVMVRQCHYSVPARLIGRRVRVLLRASEVVVFDGRAEVARHERCTNRGEPWLESMPPSSACSQFDSCTRLEMKRFWSGMVHHSRSGRGGGGVCPIQTQTTPPWTCAG